MKVSKKFIKINIGTLSLFNSTESKRMLKNISYDDTMSKVKQEILFDNKVFDSEYVKVSISFMLR